MQQNIRKVLLGPAPRDFVGYGPLTEPESLAVYNFTLQHNFRLILAYHSQGEVIYWQFQNYNPPYSFEIGTQFANVSGYSLAGSVEPRYEVEIKPQISGIISELRKEAGQMVQAGEIIATIKVIPEMVQLNSAESRVNIADISLKQVEETYKRDELLFKQGVIAQEDFDLSKANYLKAVEEKENAQSALEIIRDGIAKNSNVASTTQIRSTITGMILDIPVKVGNSVIQANNFNDGTTIATVANMNDMIFKGNVDETEIGRIHEGMPIKLTIGAMESRSFEALLEYVSPKGVEKNGAIQFEIKAAVTIPEDAFIRAGYSANAEIVLKRAEDVLTIPESTVEFQGDSAFVQLVKQEQPEQVFEKHPVKVGLSDGIKIEVQEGLAATDKVRGAAIDPNKK